MTHKVQHTVMYVGHSGCRREREQEEQMIQTNAFRSVNLWHGALLYITLQSLLNQSL